MNNDHNVVAPPIQVVTIDGQTALLIPFTSLKATPIKLESSPSASDFSTQIDTVHSLVFTAANGQQYSAVTNIQSIAAVQNLHSTTYDENTSPSTSDDNVKSKTLKAFKLNETINQELEMTTSSLRLINNDAENFTQSISSLETSPCPDYDIKSEPQVYVGRYLQKEPNDKNQWQGISDILGNFNHKTESADSTPDTVTTEEEQEEDISVTKKVRRKDIQRVRRELCSCPNCQEGEKHSDRRRIHLCHIPGCNKTYRKSYNLKVHLRKHNDDKPFTCKWLFCGKQFTRLDQFKKHQLVHTTEKNFECKLCYKRFRRKDHLSLHLVRQHKQSKQKLGRADDSSKLLEI